MIMKKEDFEMKLKEVLQLEWGPRPEKIALVRQGQLINLVHKMFFDHNSSKKSGSQEILNMVFSTYFIIPNIS